MVRSRLAVVLFNLGGPDRLEAVEPFLYNLFSDRAIIGLPNPLRRWVARLIARRRGPVAREIYERLGGRSPLLPNTVAQSQALALRLAGLGEVAVFPCMRAWHPMSDAVAAEVKAFGAERIVLLPLYPQFSTTTTASSLEDWHRAARAAGLTAPTSTVCCYPDAPGFIEGLAALTQAGIEAARRHGRPVRVLFSAHGLPERIVEKSGDPYLEHARATAAALATRLSLGSDEWVLCFQSRVGPVAWVKPYTDEEVRRAGRDGVALVVVPIAFVSEHSETLVELDMDFRKVADEALVPLYIRVPAVGTHPAFIDALGTLVEDAVSSGPVVRSGRGPRICGVTRRACVHA